MVVVRLDVGVLPGDLLEYPPPEVVGVREHVGLGDEGQVLSAASLASQLEGVAHAALRAVPRREHDLSGHLVRGVLVGEAAGSHVKVFGVLPDDDEVDLIGALVLQGAVDPLVEDDGTQVDVLVEGESQLEEQPLLQDPGSDVGVSHRAEVDAVERSQLVEGSVGKDLSRLQVAVASEVELLRGVLQLLLARHGLQDLEPLLHDLRPRSVSGKDRDLVHPGVLSPRVGFASWPARPSRFSRPRGAPGPRLG